MCTINSSSAIQFIDLWYNWSMSNSRVLYVVWVKMWLSGFEYTLQHILEKHLLLCKLSFHCPLHIYMMSAIVFNLFLKVHSSSKNNCSYTGKSKTICHIYLIIPKTGHSCNLSIIYNIVIYNKSHPFISRDWTNLSHEYYCNENMCRLFIAHTITDYATSVCYYWWYCNVFTICVIVNNILRVDLAYYDWQVTVWSERGKMRIRFTQFR